MVSKKIHLQRKNIMKKIMYLFLFMLPFYLGSQTTISGSVKDEKGRPIDLVNIYIKNVFDGSITDSKGGFTFMTSAKGKAILSVSSLGYISIEKEITIGLKNLLFDFILQEATGSLDEIVISAGVFDASDKKKGSILKPLDIVTNPGANGDMYAALATLPGVTPVGNETGLFVRGGEATETKTIIDGTLVTKPFFSAIPDIPSRGRFDPFLFKGTLFSTGGYSAQYGQALSSVLVLNTNDMPSKNSASFDVNMAGLGASFTKVWKEKTAVLGTIGYTNLSTLFSLVPQNRVWDTAPTGASASIGFRHRTAQGGIYKSFLQYGSGTVALNFQSSENEASNSKFTNSSKNVFWNNSFSGYLNDHWKVFLTGSFSFDVDKDQFNEQASFEKDWLGQSRVSLSRRLGKLQLRFGGEMQWFKNEFMANDEFTAIDNTLTALYIESDIKLSEKLAVRVGLRGEQISVLDDSKIMPRLSLSYRLGHKSLVSFAYGTFYQTPQKEYLRKSTQIDFEKATHYIANFQWKTNQRLFRIEAYFKDYNQLIIQEHNLGLNNSGTGFSKGIDVFWRDQKSIEKLTYWLSYSFVDSKRLYRDFPIETTPTFVSKHNVSLVANYKLTPLVRAGFAYSFATGKPYFNPNNEVFLDDTTIDYHNLNFSASYLASIFGNFSVIFASIKNPFSFKQIFGYRYSDDGTQRSPILPSTNWSFFAGISISLE